MKSLPYDQCLEDLRHTEEQTFLFVIAGFGILLLAGTMISVDIYVPLRKITRRISDIAPDAPQNTDAMLESLNHLIESNSNARQIQTSLRAMVRGEVLQGLLFGSQEYESPEALIREYDLQLLSDRPIRLCLIDGLRLPLYLECVRDGQARCEGVIVHNEYTILSCRPSRSRRRFWTGFPHSSPPVGSWWGRRRRTLPPYPGLWEACGVL